jgi:hypothetical protein
MRMPSDGKQSTDFDFNLELVVSMGGDKKKGYDPIPPDNYLCFMTDKDPVQRVVAWVRSKTIRFGHRSPFAVSLGGIALTKRDLAKDCFDGDLPAAWKAWRRASERGLVFEDAEGRLCLAGKAKMAARSKRGEKSRQKSLETICPRYVIEKLKLLEDGGRAAEVQLVAVEEYYRCAIKDVVTLLEIECDAIKDQVLTHHLGEGNGLRQLKKKKRRDLHERGKSELISFTLHNKPAQLELFLTTSNEYSRDHETVVFTKQVVLSTEAKGGVRGEANSQGSQQLAGDVPLRTSKGIAAKGTPPPSSPVVPFAEAAVAAATAVEQLSIGLEIDIDAAGRIWTETQSIEPAVTVDEVIALAVGVLGTKKVASSRTGMLIQYVPKAAAAGPLKVARKRLEAVALRPGADPILYAYLERIHGEEWRRAQQVEETARAKAVLADLESTELGRAWAESVLGEGRQAKGAGQFP